MNDVAGFKQDSQRIRMKKPRRSPDAAGSCRNISTNQPRSIPAQLTPRKDYLCGGQHTKGQKLTPSSTVAIAITSRS